MTKQKTSSLAPVQRKTLEFLRDFIADHGFAPTLKDIAQRIGVKSPSTAHFHLERLVKKGLISRGEDGMIELHEHEEVLDKPFAVPLVGTIAAGQPIDAIEQSTTIDIPPHMIPAHGEIYCLEVSGDSMIDEHICDGDIVVIKKQETAENNQIVVAVLEDETATLKKFRRLKTGQIMLVPANPNMEPITVDRVEIRGILMGLIREMH